VLQQRVYFFLRSMSHVLIQKGLVHLNSNQSTAVFSRRPMSFFDCAEQHRRDDARQQVTSARRHGLLRGGQPAGFSLARTDLGEELAPGKRVTVSIARRHGRDLGGKTGRRAFLLERATERAKMDQEVTPSLRCICLLRNGANTACSELLISPNRADRG
jgi:hypothetical protein